MTLTRRLFVLVAIALAPAVLIQAYNELDLRRSREKEVHELAVRQAELAASELDQIFTGVRNLLLAVAKVPSIQELDTPRCVAYLAMLQPSVPYLYSISALDLQGRLLCRQAMPPQNVTFADRSYFQDAIANDRFVIGEYTDGRLVNRPVLPLALPLRDSTNQIIGVVAAALDLGWLSKFPRSFSVSCTQARPDRWPWSVRMAHPGCWVTSLLRRREITTSAPASPRKSRSPRWIARRSAASCSS